MVVEQSQSWSQSVEQQPAVVADVDRSANVCTSICDQLKPHTVDITIAQAFGSFCHYCTSLDGNFP